MDFRITSILTRLPTQAEFFQRHYLPSSYLRVEDMRRIETLEKQKFHSTEYLKCLVDLATDLLYQLLNLSGLLGILEVPVESKTA